MEYSFDQQQAIELVQALHKVTGLGCVLYTLDGSSGIEALYNEGACRFMCHRAQDNDIDFWCAACKALHRQAAEFSYSFGEAYYYQCDEDRIFVAAPIVSTSGLVAAITIGPVHIFDIEDNQKHRGALRPFPVRAPAYVHYVANLLSMAAVSVSESSQNLLMLSRRAKSAQQADIHHYIKEARGKRSDEYPLAIEHELAASVKKGDMEAARDNLNALLGFLLSSPLIGRGYTLHQRAYELCTVITRAGMEAGADSAVMLSVSERYSSEIAKSAGNDRISKALLDLLSEVVSITATIGVDDYDGVSCRIVDFIRANYAGQITLDDVAHEVGLSPTYLSKSFKRRFGSTFSAYLNQVRVRAGKNLLLTTTKSVADIAEATGFNDISYFTRVFKKATGVSPRSYRSQRGRIANEEKDAYGACAQEEMKAG